MYPLSLEPFSYRATCPSSPLLRTYSPHITPTPTFSGSYVNLLVKLVEETLSKRTKIQRLADRFSHYFVQFVVPSDMEDQLLRIEFWDDEIDSITLMDALNRHSPTKR